jgi:hypothetical protein
MKGVPLIFVFAVDIDFVVDQKLHGFFQIGFSAASLHKMKKWCRPFFVNAINIDTFVYQSFDFFQVYI